MCRLFFALLLIMLVSNCEKKNIEQKEAETDQKKFNNNVSALYLENLNQQIIDSSDLIIVGVSSLGGDWFIKKM